MVIFFAEIALAKLNHQKTAEKKHNVEVLYQRMSNLF